MIVIFGIIMLSVAIVSFGILTGNLWIKSFNRIFWFYGKYVLIALCMTCCVFYGKPWGCVPFAAVGLLFYVMMDKNK